MKVLNVGIFVFDDAEVLDVAGPFEVFSRTRLQPGLESRQLLDDEEILSWIKKIAASATRVPSVCTGALLLAKAGRLRNKQATTHWGALSALAAIDPTIRVTKERYVDQGILTSAGISAGIAMALHLVLELLGPEVSADTARDMEYLYRIAFFGHNNGKVGQRLELWVVGERAAA
jgi:transcriptional regulator GlxA family with amidase domain